MVKTMRGRRYILMMDEVADWCDPIDISRDDIELLMRAGALHYDPSTGR